MSKISKVQDIHIQAVSATDDNCIDLKCKVTFVNKDGLLDEANVVTEIRQSDWAWEPAKGETKSATELRIVRNILKQMADVVRIGLWEAKDMS